jgi:hypothetical protein
MENSHIEVWDLRGWMGIEEPTPNAQREWNKTLLQKINLISNKIQYSSLKGGADTIIIHPDLEVLFHPDHYDNFSKKLMGMFNVLIDPTMDRNRIELNNRRLLEDLQFIPIRTENEVQIKLITSCSKDEIVKYIEGLVGFVLIDNI